MLRIAGESRAGYREMLYKWCNGADSQELQATCMWAGVWVVVGEEHGSH